MDLIETQNIKSRLQKEGRIPIRIVSGSMKPLIEVGETLEMQPHENEFHTFDLIVFQQFDRLVCHYVWRNQVDFNNTLVTRSLQDIFTDEVPIPLNQVLGIVKAKKISLLTKLKILFQNWIKGRL